MTTKLEIGDEAPDFTAQNARGKEVSLSDYAGKKVVLYFYPRAMTPGCTKEACDFRDNLEAFNNSGYEVIGISPDSPAKLQNFENKKELPFTLLSDENKEIATAYGAYGEKKNYGKIFNGIIRSTFVIDEEGKIAMAKYNVKATGHVARMMKELSV
ncbi:MAG: thioredoxin-dependent thiol peroxidase [Micrococcaceae bacterium]